MEFSEIKLVLLDAPIVLLMMNLIKPEKTSLPPPLLLLGLSVAQAAVSGGRSKVAGLIRVFV